MAEEDECEQPEPLTCEQIEEWADEASEELMRVTGAILPRLTSSPRRARDSVTCLEIGIRIPRGNLFYPCCGTDTSDPIRLFGKCIAACDFADPHIPLPRSGRTTQHDRHRVDIPHIETVLSGPGNRQDSTTEGEHAVRNYQKDGLLTFIEDVSEMSVFYYCGDTYGEGGSNQRWLEPVLFHAVLSKLLDGGLIVSDGSNCGYWNDDFEIYAPWNALCGRRPFDAPEPGTSFVYANRRFVCFGEANASRVRKPSVWQVGCADEI